MSSDEALKWTVVVALIVCVALGLAIVSVSIRDGLKKIATLTIIYALVGLIFLSAPKWSTLTFEFMGMKATMAQLQKEKAILAQQNATLLAQSEQMTQELASYKGFGRDIMDLSASKDKTAGDALEIFRKVGTSLGLSDFASAKFYAIKATSEDDQAIRAAIGVDGTGSADVVKDLEDKGYFVLKNADVPELDQTKPEDLWVSPIKPNT